jgi:uncharacterized iron-regulated membrane protein
MASIRTWHTYLGLLIAPSVMFFALTGALQLFGLHEAHGNYRPPPVIEKLGMLHKNQVFAQPERHEPEREAGGRTGAPTRPPEDEDEPAARSLVLKGFFLLVALGLTASTMLGLWIGLTHVRRKRTGWLVLGLGFTVPLAVLIS